MPRNDEGPPKKGARVKITDEMARQGFVCWRRYGHTHAYAVLPQIEDVYVTTSGLPGTSAGVHLENRILRGWTHQLCRIRADIEPFEMV